MSAHSHPVTKILTLIVILSVLLTSVPLPAQAAPVSREAVATDVPFTLGAAWEWLTGATRLIWRRAANTLVSASRAPIFDPPAPTLLLSAQAVPETVMPGDEFDLVIRLVNNGDQPLVELAFDVELPKSVHRVPQAEGWTFDRREKRLSTKVDVLEAGAEAVLMLPLRANGPVDISAEIAVRARSGDEAAVAAATAAVTATVWVTQPGRASFAESGGELTSPSGRVRVHAPPGAVKRAAEVSVMTYAEKSLPPGKTGRALRFSLGPDMAFEQPVTVSVDLGDLVSLKDLPKGYRPYLIYWKDRARGEWEYVPLKSIDWDSGVITAELEHFSEYDSGVVSDNGWQPSFNDATVSGFRGALSYGIPLEVLPERGGLQPQLNLTYNSDRINGLLADSQSDWVGLGWSLDVPQIVRRDWGWCPWAGSQYCFDTSHTKYTMILNGSGYELIPDPATDPCEVPHQAVGRYHTDDETFAYIERRAGATNYLGTDWKVTTKDGTTYYFGSTEDSEQVLNNVGQLSSGQAVYRWRLHKIVDVHRNEVLFEYYEHEPGSLYHRASYLSDIWYNKKAPSAQLKVTGPVAKAIQE